MMLIDRDEPNNALKLVQLADLHLIDAPRGDSRVPALRSWLAVESALAQAQMSDTESTARRVRSDLARARDGYDPPDSHARADMDLVTALVHLHLGALDIVESMASVSVRTFAQGTDRREGILADITLARLHVQAGEPDAPRLAASAISAVAPLRSGVARAGLAPLAAELETRPRADLRELARLARQVAASLPDSSVYTVQVDHHCRASVAHAVARRPDPRIRPSGSVRPSASYVVHAGSTDHAYCQGSWQGVGWWSYSKPTRMEIVMA
jgi:hypothetical protein